MGFFSAPKTVIPDIGKLSSQATQSVSANLPQLLASLQAGQAGQAQLQTDIAKAQSPQLADLMLSLYQTYGPALAQAGNAVRSADVAGQAETARTVGKDYATSMMDIAKIFDPEYFNTRANTSDAIAKLLGNIDISGQLSGGERTEIERSLNQEGMRRGTNNAPSALDTVGNAMQYGGASRTRQMEGQNALAQAIASASGFMGASRSGFDPSAATGGNQPNQGSALFTGIQDSGGGKEAFNLGQNLAGQTFGMAAQQATPYKTGGGIGHNFASGLIGGLGSALGSGLVGSFGKSATGGNGLLGLLG